MRKEYEEKSKQEQQDAERSRALDAIKLEIAREEPQASTLKRALGKQSTFTLLIILCFSSSCFVEPACLVCLFALEL